MYHGYPMVMGRDVAFKASISSINPCKVSLISWTSLCSVASWSFCWWFFIQKMTNIWHVGSSWRLLAFQVGHDGSRWICGFNRVWTSDSLTTDPVIWCYPCLGRSSCCRQSLDLDDERISLWQGAVLRLPANMDFDGYIMIYDVWDIMYNCFP